jgi:hypothetical protein
MKKMLFLLAILVPATLVQAQYVADALKYSQTFPTLTARSLSMGGAFTSLGGDFSSALLNPAGLGMYRKSEFQFTPLLGMSKTDAQYQGQSNSDFKYQFAFGSLGYVGTFNSKKDKGLVSASYAMGYSRQNNFNNNTYIRGTNTENSLSDYFMNYADGYDPETLDPFYERLAFDGYIIDTVPGSDYAYSTPVPLPVSQKKTVASRGGVGTWNFATGLNFSNVFYAGIGIGLHQLRLDKTSVHSEFDPGNPGATDFYRFIFTEDLNVEGSGFSVNMGAMVRVAKVLRIGTSLQLPTVYRIQEHYYNTLYSEFDNGDYYNVYPTDQNGDKLEEGSFKYRLTTPLKANAGMSLQLGSSGIITADAEFVDYANMRLRERDDYTDFSQANQDIKDVYRSVVNLRMGGEMRFDNVSVRVGGGIYPSPCQSISRPGIYDYIGTVPKGYTELTAGIGYRTNNFFFDLGLSRLSHTEFYNLYWDNESELKQAQIRMLATVGFRF